MPELGSRYDSPIADRFKPESSFVWHTGQYFEDGVWQYSSGARWIQRAEARESGELESSREPLHGQRLYGESFDDLYEQYMRGSHDYQDSDEADNLKIILRSRARSRF